MVWTEFWRIRADKNAQILGFWDQASDMNFPGPLSAQCSAITSLRKFESPPCACVNLGWPIILHSAVGGILGLLPLLIYWPEVSE